MAPLAVMIMAAGRSSRFNGCKALAEFEGLPLVQHAIDSALGVVTAEDIFVLSGCWHKELKQAFDQQRIHSAELIYCPEWSLGLGHSIAHGVAELDGRYESILLMLADQVAVSVADLAKLLNQAEGADIVCGFYGGRRGAPALFSLQCFPKLRTLEGDKGAKALLYDGDFKVVEEILENAVLDVDEPADLLRLKKNIPACKE